MFEVAYAVHKRRSVKFCGIVFDVSDALFVGSREIVEVGNGGIQILRARWHTMYLIHDSNDLLSYLFADFGNRPLVDSHAHVIAVLAVRVRAEWSGVRAHAMMRLLTVRFFVALTLDRVPPPPLLLLLLSDFQTARAQEKCGAMLMVSTQLRSNRGCVALCSGGLGELQRNRGK